MAVRLVPPRPVVQPLERPLWAMQRGERTAHALVRAFPHGHELVITVDGELRWSQLFRGDAGELDAGAERKRQALLERG